MNFIVLGSTGWLTSCVDNIDNPSGEVDPVTPATNPVEESVFSKLMDHTTYCGDDFYQYGVGQWIKENPVPTEDEDEVVYNPQNEMFVGFQTKSIFPQNEKSFWFLI